MRKVLIAIPTHCAPKIVLTTVGTWLETFDGSYEAEIVMGIHENYGHYHDGLRLIVDQIPGMRISTVPEMRWGELQDWRGQMMRYSKMHAANLAGIIRFSMGIGFDYMAILDHDLVFKGDFIEWGMNSGSDLVGCMMGDRTADNRCETPHGEVIYAPKFSVWHAVMSSDFYCWILKNIDVIGPRFKNGVFHDTFSMVPVSGKMSGMDVRVVPEAQIADMVDHRWSMSFNFGQYIRGGGGHAKKTSDVEAEYDRRFPNGIREMVIEKIGGKNGG